MWIISSPCFAASIHAWRLLLGPQQIACIVISESRPCLNRWMSCETSVRPACVANTLNSETYLSTGLDNCLRAYNYHKASPAISNG